MTDAFQILSDSSFILSEDDRRSLKVRNYLYKTDKASAKPSVLIDMCYNTGYDCLATRQEKDKVKIIERKYIHIYNIFIFKKRKYILCTFHAHVA
jgi:hypothetical protein